MKRKLLVLSIMLFATIAYSQSNFIEFKDGKVINFGEEPIKEKNPMFKKSVLKVSGESYDIETIKGYQYNGTYYAQNFGGFFPREVQGNITYYKRIDYYTDGRGRTRQIIVAYLQKGENQKWVPYSNNALIRMVSDNKKAKALAASYKRSMRLSNMILIGGGLVLFAGAMTIVVSQMSDKKSSNLLAPGIILASAGLGGVVLSYVRRYKTANNIVDILKYYNKA